MCFADKLREEMNKKSLTITELSLLSGVSKSNISQYLSEKNIPRSDIKKKLEDVLACTFDEIKVNGDQSLFIFSTNTITVRKAARIMHISEQTLREQLIKREIPIGYAYQGEGANKRGFYISPKLFYEFTGWRE